MASKLDLVAQALGNQVLNISMDGNSKSSLENLLQCSISGVTSSVHPSTP